MSAGCHRPTGTHRAASAAAFVLGGHFGATLSSFQYLLQWRFLPTCGLQTGKKFIPALHQTLRQLQGAKRRFSGSSEALGIVIFLLKINAGGGGSTLNIGSALFWAFHYSSHLALRRAAALTFPYVMTTKSHGSCKAAIKRPLRRLQQHARRAAAN